MDLETAMKSIYYIHLDSDQCVVRFRHVENFDFIDETVCVHPYGWKPFTCVEFAAFAVTSFVRPDFFTSDE